MTNVITFGKVPPAPDDLTPEQAQRWREIAGSMPADWFKACDLPLLREMVLALDTSHEMAEILKRSRTIDEMKRVLDLRDREVRRAAALARTLRISPQSRYDRHAAGKAGRASGNRPWDESDPGDELLNEVEARMQRTRLANRRQPEQGNGEPDDAA